MSFIIRWTVLSALALALAGPALAGTGTGAGHKSPAPPEDSQASAGMLPIPEYDGDWQARPALTGDWGGLRTDLANQGVTFGLKWLQIGQGVVSGGIDERAEYATNLDYIANLDLMRMGAIPGALVSFRAQSRFGLTVNDKTGVLLPVNTYSLFPFTDPIHTDVPFTITELNWTQMLSDSAGILLGKITTLRSSNEFAGGEGRSQFMNFQFSFSAVFAQVAPYSTLAVGGFVMPSPHVTVSTILMNTADASTTTGFADLGKGTTWTVNLDAQYRLGGLPGGALLMGLYAFSGDFTQIGGINLDPDGLQLNVDKSDSSWAVFASAWQYVYVEEETPDRIDPGDGRQDLQGLGIFLEIGVADQDTNPVSWSATGGLSGRGSIPGRDDDTWGVGYFYNFLQEARNQAHIPHSEHSVFG
jgi:porin